MICPFYKNEEVFNGFNEIIEALGGRPMTEEEFRSGDLRMQRSGLDFSAMEAAYRIYHLNNGNLPNLAPNGQQSLLFDSLLQLFNGDKKKAIEAKSQFYSKSFTDKFGMWMNEDLFNEQNVDHNLVDVNGEPILFDNIAIPERTFENDPLMFKYKFSESTIQSIFGKEDGKRLLAGELIDSGSVIERLLSKKTFSENNMKIANILSKHSIPIKIQNIDNNSFMSTITDANGNSVIVINPAVLSTVSNNYTSDTLLHELIHAVTVNALNNPKTFAEKKFAKMTNELYNTFDKLFPKNKFNRLDIEQGYYILNNVKEFAAVFATDKDARYLLFSKALEEDRKGNKVLRKIKDFINTFSKIIVNKKIFYTNEEKLKLYERQFKKYLIQEDPVITTNKSAASLLKAFRNSTSDRLIGNEAIQTMFDEISFKIEGIEKNDMLNVSSMYSSFKNPYKVSTNEAGLKALNDAKISIAEKLQKRLNAIRVSNLPDDQKTQNIQVLQSQIQQLQNNNLSDFIIFGNLLAQFVPQLVEDHKKILKIHRKQLTMSDTDYMYYKHDYFGAYKAVLETIKNVLSYGTVETILESQIAPDTKSKSFVEDMEKLVQLADTAYSISDTSSKLLDSILIQNILQDLYEIGSDVNSPTMIKYLQNLKTIDYDTSWFVRHLGRVDAAKDDGLRTLAYLVNKANQEADEKTIQRASVLLKLKDKLAFDESVKDLYEVDDKGRTTGYLIRKLNYGKFYNNYNREMKRINNHISKKYNIELDENNRLAPDNQEARIEWNRMRNEWLSKNCERRFTREYYEHYDNLSEKTRMARDAIQNQITPLKQKCLGEDGYYHYDRLTEKEYQILNGLYIQKKQLSSDYDLNGNLKIEGTDEYEIAKELQNLYNSLYSDDSQVKRDTEAWKRDRDEVIARCGGALEMAKGKDGNFDFKTLEKWDERNSKIQLKRDEDGNPLLWKRIDDETYEIPVYEVDGDGGAAYEENLKRINELLKPYRNQNTWDIDPGRLPKSIQTKIRSLERENARIKRKAYKQDKNIKKISKQRYKVFKKYAKWAPTEAYNKLSRVALIKDETVPGTYEQFLASTGYFSGFEENSLDYRRYRWYNRVEVLPEYREEFTEFVPGDGYINTDDSNKYKNPNFDENVAEGSWFIPKAFDENKRALYDNSRAFNRVKNSIGLNALYEEIFKMMQESNNELFQRQYADNYLLPQITGSFYKRLKNQGAGGKFAAAWRYIKDGVGIGNKILPDDTDYGTSIDDVIENADDIGEIIENGIQNFSNRTRGVRADGRQLNIIPQYYTRKLQDPSQLSADLIGIVSEYYDNAFRFSEKSKIKDKCESILDMMKNREYVKDGKSLVKTVKNGEEEKLAIEKTGTPSAGENSNTYLTAKKFLEMNLYNIRDTNQITIRGRQYNLGKIAQLFRAATVAINLGLNPAVAVTGFTTSTFAHMVNAITGQKYGIQEAFLAAKELVSRSLGVVFSVGDKTSNNKIVALMEAFNVADRGKRKYKHSNRNRAVNIVNDNHTFGMLTFFDFIVKSQVMISTLMSFRLYNGEFVTKEDLMLNNYKLSSQDKKSIKGEWKKGVCLYSIFDVKNGQLVVKPEYEEAFEKIKHVVSSRINGYAEHADGMATETQKASITTSFMGACVLTHRQYLPLMLQERFGETTYNMDTQQYQGGVFRTLFLTVEQLFLAIRDGFVNKSIKQVVTSAIEREKKLFNDETSDLSYQTSRARQYHMKQIAAEVSLFLISKAFIAALVGMADDDKDDKLLQFMAYIALRTEWEVFTPYRAQDMLSNIKSPSANTGTIDKFEAIFSSSIKLVMPQGDLYNTFLRPNLKDDSYNPKVQKGTYKDWYKIERDLFKVLPAHNLYEQYNDSYSKRNYYKHRIMNAE